MRICFVGKGGSGKTTVSSQFSKYILDTDSIKNKLIIDADHNQHLRQFLAGQNSSIAEKSIEEITSTLDTDGLIKTSLPKSTSSVFSLEGFCKQYKTNFIFSGNLDRESVGSSCYHKQIGKIESILLHIIDDEKDVIVSDMTAGSDIFGSSYFIHFDCIIGVCEPTFESVSVLTEIRAHLKTYNINFKIIANKIFDEEDELFIQKHFDASEIIGYIQFQRIRSKNESIKIDKKILGETLSILCNTPKNWQQFQTLLHTFHEKNRNSWAKNTKPHQNDFSYHEIATAMKG